MSQKLEANIKPTEEPHAAAPTMKEILERSRGNLSRLDSIVEDYIATENKTSQLSRDVKRAVQGRGIYTP